MNDLSLEWNPTNPPIPRAISEYSGSKFIRVLVSWRVGEVTMEQAREILAKMRADRAAAGEVQS